jgi:hypothetical protein
LSTSSYVGLLVSTGASGGNMALGKALQGSGSGAGAPTISFNGFGSNSLTIPASNVITTVTGASTALPTLQNVGGLDLDWGRWDDVQIESKHGTVTLTKDVMWAVFIPTATMPSPTGTAVRYGNNSTVPINGIDDTGGALRSGVIEFDVTFGQTVDAISNGSMVVFDSRNLSWNITFNGDLSGPYVKMTDVTGTFNTTGNVTGTMAGAFTGTGLTPDFVTGFSLTSGSNFIQGTSLLNNEDCFTCAVVP